MQTRESATDEQLTETIHQFFGFMPPLFTPAQQTPHILHNLFQQTVSAYIQNPIPLLVKEQLFAYLSRYCSVRYCILCHSCALPPFGLSSRDILVLLETPLPTESAINTELSILEMLAAPLSQWPEPASALGHSLRACATFLFLQPGRAERCRLIMRHILGETYYNALVEFLAYVKTCHFWVETHPEIAPEADKRVQDHLAALLADEPVLATFFNTYHEQANIENEYIVRDHAARKIIEERLQATEEQALANLRQLEATFEAMTDGVVVYDTAGHMLRVNAAYRRMIALDLHPEHALLTPDERGTILALRDETGQLLPPEQRPVARMLRGEEMTGKNMLDIIVYTLDDNTRQLNVSGAPMRDAGGHIVGGVIIFRDVTQRRQLERRTHETLEGLLAIAETIVRPFTSPTATSQPPSTSSPAIMTTTGERIVKLTQSMMGCQRVSLLAIEPETEIIHPLVEIGLTPQLHQLWWKSMENARLSDIIAEPPLLAMARTGQEYIIDTAKPPYNRHPNPFGSASILAAPLFIDNQLIGLLSFDFYDTPHEYTEDEITLTKAIARLTALVIERERLLRERTEAQANELALIEANRRMDEFMGIASHELKTPLTTIKGYVQLVSRRLKQGSRAGTIQDNGQQNILESASELLTRTDHQVERLGRLVNELLDVSRIQANKLDFHPERCDLVPIVRDAVHDQLLESEAVTRTIEIDIAPTENVPIMADADRIGQVIANFLSNALKYSTEEQPVTVSLQKEGERVRLLVRDHGPGLRPEDQQQIWERFYRVEGIEVQSGSGIGLGLGLYICRTIIEGHGGQVGVESSPGQGSTFWFSVPLAAEHDV